MDDIAYLIYTESINKNSSILKSPNNITLINCSI